MTQSTPSLLPLRIAMGGAIGVTAVAGIAAAQTAAQPATEQETIRLPAIDVEGNASRSDYQSTIPALSKLSQPLLDTPRGAAFARGTFRHMSAAVQRPALLVADRWHDYALLDCGDGLKQERWGEFTLVRPDPQIIWPRHGGSEKNWSNWDGFYHRSETGGGV